MTCFFPIWSIDCYIASVAIFGIVVQQCSSRADITFDLDAQDLCKTHKFKVKFNFHNFFSGKLIHSFTSIIYWIRTWNIFGCCNAVCLCSWGITIKEKKKKWLTSICLIILLRTCFDISVNVNHQCYNIIDYNLLLFDHIRNSLLR